MSPPTPKPNLVTLVVLQSEEVENVIIDVVTRVLRAHEPAPPRQLLTRDEAAEFLRVSVRQVDLLRDAGLPTRWVGDSPRFKAEELDAWTVRKPGTKSSRSGKKKR